MSDAALKNSEKRIEQVLGGLRAIQAPEGMELRVLRRLEERANFRGAEASWWRGLSRPVVGWGLGVAGVMAIALVVVGVRRTNEIYRGVQAGGVVVQQKVTPTVSRTNDSVVAEIPSRKVSRKVAATFGLRQVDSVAALGGEKQSDAVSVPDPSATAGSTADVNDAVAMAQIMAPSLVAPPMPLTDQERLMLDILHRGDPVQIAMLNPEVRAMRDAEDRAEVRRFFVKPSPAVLEQPETNKGEK